MQTAAKRDVPNSNLSLLEDKVVQLVELAKNLKAKNDQLVEENVKLKQQVDILEASLVAETKDLEELSQEKITTKMVVDDLIKSIDLLASYKD